MSSIQNLGKAFNLPTLHEGAGSDTTFPFEIYNVSTSTELRASIRLGAINGVVPTIGGISIAEDDPVPYFAFGSNATHRIYAHIDIDSSYQPTSYTLITSTDPSANYSFAYGVGGYTEILIGWVNVSSGSISSIFQNVEGNLVLWTANGYFWSTLGGS